MGRDTRETGPRNVREVDRAVWIDAGDAVPLGRAGLIGQARLQGDRRGQIKVDMAPGDADRPSAL